jgi:hypothetical protein
MNAIFNSKMEPIGILIQFYHLDKGNIGIIHWDHSIKAPITNIMKIGDVERGEGEIYQYLKDFNYYTDSTIYVTKLTKNYSIEINYTNELIRNNRAGLNQEHITQDQILKLYKCKYDK